MKKEYSKAEIDRHVDKKFKEWLDNSDPDNLGIIKWAKDILPEYLPQNTPEFHKELYQALLELFDPSLINRLERQLLITSYRGSAKSTVANMVFASYLVANNGRTMKIRINNEVVEVRILERFIVIISETGTMAEDFTVRIRDEFSTNPNIRYYYQLQIENAYDDITGKWTRAAFKMNGCFVLGVGTGMQIRGRIKGAYRITTVLFDDIYSERNVKTPESRENIAKWFNDAVKNSIDDLVGKAVLMGTILHDDTLLISLEKNPLWTKIKYSIMPLDRFHKFMAEHLDINYDTQTCFLPYDNIKDDHEKKRKNRQYFQALQDKEDWGLAWKERQNLYFLALQVQDKVISGRMASLYQEYFHQVIPDQDKQIRKDYFVHKKYEHKYEHYYNWIKFENDEEWQVCTIEFGIDLSTGDGKDNGVITVLAILGDNRIVVLLQRAGKFITRDDMKNDVGDDVRFGKVITDRTKIQRAGIIDETFRLSMIYHPRKIKVGVGGQEKSVAKQFRQVFNANGEYVTIFENIPQTRREGDKVTRILDVLVGLYETRMIIHGGPLTELEYELEFLGKASMDDRADSLATAATNYQLPPNIDESFFVEVEVNSNIYDIRRAGNSDLSMANRWRVI